MRANPGEIKKRINIEQWMNEKRRWKNKSKPAYTNKRAPFTGIGLSPHPLIALHLYTYTHTHTIAIFHIYCIRRVIIKRSVIIIVIYDIIIIITV